MKKRQQSLALRNRKLAKQLWGDSLNRTQLRLLGEITESFKFSVASGDVRLLQGGWYVTHTGLIRLAERRHCAGIHVEPIKGFQSNSIQGEGHDRLCWLRRCRFFQCISAASRR